MTQTYAKDGFVRGTVDEASDVVNGCPAGLRVSRTITDEQTIVFWNNQSNLCIYKQ